MELNHLKGLNAQRREFRELQEQKEEIRAERKQTGVMIQGMTELIKTLEHSINRTQGPGGQARQSVSGLASVYDLAGNGSRPVSHDGSKRCDGEYEYVVCDERSEHGVTLMGTTQI